VLAVIDNHGHVLSPLTVAPVNEVDMVLLPQGLKDLKRVAREVGLDLSGAVLNLDAGFDSKANRKAVFNAGLKPNIKGTGCKFTQWSKCSKAKGLREKSKEFGRRQDHAE
jgi:hypothetical protein